VFNLFGKLGAFVSARMAARRDAAGTREGTIAPLVVITMVYFVCLKRSVLVGKSGVWCVALFVCFEPSLVSILLKSIKFGFIYLQK
jgi:hypothetical protein